MTPETFIIAKASEAIQALYSVEVPEAQLQVQVTRKEFEGDYTLVVFPLLKVSKTTPENTGNAIGEWLKTNVAEVSGYNTVHRHIPSGTGRIQLPSGARFHRNNR